jgi:flagellar biosynthesis anti-sigma factor FlgM
VKIDRSPSQSGRDTSRVERPARAADQAGAASGGGPRDAIELSSDARRVIQMPQDRGERAKLVDRLRQEVDAGTYRPDAEAIARRIAEEFGR